MGKQIRVSFRTSEGFKSRLAAAAKKLGLDQSVLGAAALEAVIAHVEKHGSLTIPIRLAGLDSHTAGGPVAPAEKQRGETLGQPDTRLGGSSEGGYSLNEEPPHAAKEPSATKRSRPNGQPS